MNNSARGSNITSQYQQVVNQIDRIVVVFDSQLSSAHAHIIHTLYSETTV